MLKVNCVLCVFVFPSYGIGPGDKALVLREGMEDTEGQNYEGFEELW